MESLNGTDLKPSTPAPDGAAEAPSEATPKHTPKPAPKPTPKGAEETEHSYEEGWYQVLKRRADESDGDD